MCRRSSKVDLSSPAERDPLRGSREGKGTQVDKQYYVYMLASHRNGTLYIGVTNDLARRVWEHKNNLAEGFTKKHRVHQLVWYEAHADINHAIAREKQIKGWNRAWKIRLIEDHNSGWNDLVGTINA
jgi:putative endonuclease